MTVQPDQMLLHYRLVEKIGEGGMGVVWRAIDTSLEREAAIKILPPAFAADADRLARFEREAKLLATLDHPNIAKVHGLHEDEGIRFIAMELVSGESLAQRLERGPIPIDDALPIARQIAEALEAAHERGVIHRDLKPANVKVCDDGTVKVLDFGLAKSLASASAGADPSASPTVTSGGTLAGAILGTAAYMSPEQARGNPLDRRTDIWSFGCVLYEMLTGARCFGGKTVTDALARVLEREPAWPALPRETPSSVRELLGRCLRKDARRRLRDIGEARVAIEDLDAADAIAVTGVTERPGARLPWVIAAVLAVCVAGLAWMAWRPVSVAPRPVTRLSVILPPDHQLAIADATSLAISPDGSQLVYGASSPPGSRSRLFSRALDRFESEAIPGTEGAVGPFFSPDGRWLGYFAEGKLFRIAVDGGTPIEVCHVGQVVPGASWGEDDSILFTDSPDAGLLRVPATGGTPEQLTRPDFAHGETGHGWPQPLPGGESVLFTISGVKGTRIAVLSLRSGEWRVIADGIGGARFVPPGHLVYAQFEGLTAVAFDPVKLETVGEPIVVLKDVYLIPALAGHGLAAFAVSETGSLAYLPGGAAAGENRLVRVDREGRTRPLPAEPGGYEWPRLSPDGKKLAVTDRTPKGGIDIWVLDLERAARSRLTFEGSNILPTWTPDGKQIVFGSMRGGFSRVQIFRKSADGSGEAERILEGSNPRFPQSWSPDGRMLAFTEWHPDTMRDLWTLSLEGRSEAVPVLATEFDEHSPKLSPDGRWLAYVSDESGRYEVYVRSYPEGDGKWLVSAGGGTEMVWSADGRELFYRNRNAMLAVPVRTGPEFEAGAPVVLFEKQFKSGIYGSLSYDVAADGQEFFMIERPLEMIPTRLNVVLGWREELQARVPNQPN